MRLFHGSNTAVLAPRILAADRRLDFGPGFYLTSDLEQAKKWAVLTTERRGKGSAQVTVYDFPDRMPSELRVLTFQRPDAAWLQYTARNRKVAGASDDYDIVIGPVANDKTLPVISAYYAGIYDESETIRRLLPQRLRDQYAFKTDRAVNLLIPREVLTP